MNWKLGQQTENTTCQHRTRGAAVSLHLIGAGGCRSVWHHAHHRDSRSPCATTCRKASGMDEFIHSVCAAAKHSHKHTCYFRSEPFAISSSPQWGKSQRNDMIFTQQTKAHTHAHSQGGAERGREISMCQCECLCRAQLLPCVDLINVVGKRAVEVVYVFFEVKSKARQVNIKLLL